MESRAGPGSARASSKETEAKEGEDGKFLYQFSSNGTSYRLRVPVRGPLDPVRARELASRLVRAHNLPCYLEDELYSQLQIFARDSALRQWDEEGESALAGGSVLEEDSEATQRVDEWAEEFTEHCSLFSVATETPDPASSFSEIYHTLIHSPALETLLQLEHTYALAMENSLQAWKNARDMLEKRHDSERKQLMQLVGSTKSEQDVSLLMRQHETDRAVLEAQWRGEVRQLQETQRKSYQQWMGVAYDEMTSPAGAKKWKPEKSRRLGSGSGDEVFAGAGEGEAEAQHTPLEESFTIHLGAQLKSSHNLRLLCGNPLALCRQRMVGLRGGIMASPERLQTAMSLYSTKLSCLVLMVDPAVGQPRGMEHRFADICHRSTDFHFPAYAEQLSAVQECAVRAAEARHSAKQPVLESSSSSQTSDSQPLTPRGGSPFYSPDKVLHGASDNSSFSQHLSPPPASSGAVGGSREGGRFLESPTTEQDARPVRLQPGDFFITRHSNLSQVHVVLHLATDREAMKNPGLRARHPVMVGLKNCLHVAARNDVHHITVPLLLVHSMEPEMTIPWCLKRAELVFKCVKGFMLENPQWGNGDSRTFQFLIPQSISRDLFEEFCDMLPKIFRVSTARKLTSKTRSHSYK